MPEGSCQSRIQFFRRVHCFAFGPERARKRHKVGFPVQNGVGVVPVVEQRLPLPYHTEDAIVHQQDDHRHIVGYGGGEFIETHAEATVAGDEHTALACAERRTDGRAEAETHGAEAAAGNKAARRCKQRF